MFVHWWVHHGGCKHSHQCHAVFPFPRKKMEAGLARVFQRAYHAVAREATIQWP